MSHELKTGVSAQPSDDVPRTKAIGLTVNVTKAVASIVAVIAAEENMSDSALVKEALIALINAPRDARDREEEFKANLAAAAAGRPKRRPSKSAPFVGRISVYLDAELHAALLDYCREERLSPARTMRKAVDDYVWKAVKEAGLGDLPEVSDLVSTGVGAAAAEEEPEP